MPDVSVMVAELDDHGFADTSSTRKVAVLQDTLDDICSREKWPFLQKEATLTFDGTNPQPATGFPTDFSKVLNIRNIQDNTVPQPELWEVIVNRYPDTIGQTAPGSSPVYYYFVGSQMRFWPIPPSTTTIKLGYLAFHARINAGSLETDILLPLRHQRMLVLGALYKLYSMEDDADLGEVFRREYERRGTQMRDDLLMQQYQRSDHIYVLDEFDYSGYPG